jgi:spore maturation protein CgeB
MGMKPTKESALSSDCRVLASPTSETLSPTVGRLPIKIVYVANYYEYGQKERGPSGEYYQVYSSLKEVFQEVHFFDFYALYEEKGKEAMNAELLSFIQREQPDLTIVSLYKDEFIPEVVEQLRKHTTTLVYFYDDTWRKSFSLFWARHFDFFTTTSTSALRIYRDMGLTHAIYSPFGYNHILNQRKGLPKIYDVSFVGAFHGYRDYVVRQVRKAGINVAVWGSGWPAGRITQEAMIDVFNQSRIVLTLSNSLNWDLRFFLRSPRCALMDLRYCKKNKEQLKGRHFEVNGCGACQISYYMEDLERCYDIGNEILIFMDIDDLIEKIQYFLKHEEEREAIADAGHRRALRDHTYAARFMDTVRHIASQGRIKVPVLTNIHSQL